MKTIRYKIFVINILILVSALTINAQADYNELMEEFRKEIQKKMKKNKVVGASIALFGGDTIIWSEGFGYANTDKDLKATTETEYRIGSITKLFTGTAIMQLHERNIFNIDNSVIKTYPRFNMKTRFKSINDITIRNVMTHTAGLPSDIMKGIISYNPEDFTEEIDYLNKEHTIYAPNTVFAYSNPGFNLLGCIVEDISGTNYAQYIQTNIFDAIGMNNSYFNESHAVQLSEAYDAKGKIGYEIPFRALPAGDIKSNVKDMSKFLASFMDEKETLIKRETFEEMKRVQFDKLYEGSLQKIGIVWFIEEHEGYDRIYQHGGGTRYHRTIAKICPEQNLGIVILTNSYNGNSICRLSSEILKKAIDIKKGTTTKDAESKIKFEKQLISKKELDSWNGNYATPGAVYQIQTKKNKLITSIQGNKIDMVYAGNNEFLPIAKLLGFIPVKMKSVRFVFKKNDDDILLFQKDIKRNRLSLIGCQFEKSEISAAWENRIGSYEIINDKDGDYNIFDNFEIVKENGVLLIKTTVKMDVEEDISLGLGIISNELAYVLGKGRQGGYSVAIEYDEDNNELIRFSGYLLKKE